MSDNSLLRSNFSPDTYYQNFEQFLEGHHAMVQRYGMSYVWVYSLIRLARNDIHKGRRVFDWAVKRVCLNMLADDERFRPVCNEISPHGLKWATHAVETFGRNPLRSLSLIEGIYLLERMYIWAEIEFSHRMSGQTFMEFRKREPSNEEVSGKIAWIDLFYQKARAKAIDDSERFVKRRDCAIALAITALADGHPPSDQEIDDAMNRDFPTHQSLAKLIKDPRDYPEGSLVNKNEVVEWVLGPFNRDIGF